MALEVPVPLTEAVPFAAGVAMLQVNVVSVSTSLALSVSAKAVGELSSDMLRLMDAPSAITRLLDLGVPSYLINSTLLGVMAQRLVRTLCPHCKREVPLREEDEVLWNQIVAPWKANRPARLYQPVGCLECRMTGYSGRVGLYEIMLNSPEIKRLVQPTTEIARLRDQAYREGMRALRISGATKVAQGLTTLEEVLKVAPPAEQSAQ